MYLVEELDEVNIVGGPLEVLFQENIYGRLENERVINSNSANALLNTHDNVNNNTISRRGEPNHQVPARGTTASLGTIHHVVGHQKHGLKLQYPESISH
jgi:hypothetical protein